MQARPNGHDYGSQPPQEWGRDKCGRRLNTWQEISELESDKLVMYKMRGDRILHVARIKKYPNASGERESIFLIHRDDPNVKINVQDQINRPPFSGDWWRYLNNPLEMEVYEYVDK